MKKKIMAAVFALLFFLTAAAQISENAEWALVKLAVAHIRSEARHSSEMTTQAIMGTPLKVISQSNDWAYVEQPDGYRGYISVYSLFELNNDDMTMWRKSNRVIVTALECNLTECSTDCIVSDLLIGNILNYSDENSDYYFVTTPDGRAGKINRSDAMPFDKWAHQSPSIDKIIDTARSMTGRVYLWGGTSSKMTDCSGLTKVSFLAAGIILPRDTSQQITQGYKIDNIDDAKIGDLLFFGNKNGRVNHVAIYLGNNKFIHSSGYVKINSLDPSSPDYLKLNLLTIKRIDINNAELINNNSFYF